MQPAIIPAKTSSSIIPNPPLTFESAQDTGQGFVMSKSLNKINPIRYSQGLSPAQHKVRLCPATSSITINPGSLISTALE